MSEYRVGEIQKKDEIWSSLCSDIILWREIYDVKMLERQIGKCQNPELYYRLVKEESQWKSVQFRVL